MDDDEAADTFAVAWRRLHDVPGDPGPRPLGDARRLLANRRRGERRAGALLARLGAQPPASGPPPSPREPPGRPRSLARGAVAAAGLLALGGVIAALVVATPSGDDQPAVTTPDPFTGPLRTSLLERRQGDQDRVIDLVGEPFRLAPASLRLAVARGGGSWYAARPQGRPDAVCLVRFTPRAGGCSADGAIARNGSWIRRWSPAEGVTEFVGLVPDGIDSVQIGAASGPVHDNVFTLVVEGAPPGYAILSGPAAPAVPPAASVVTAGPSGSPPVVAVPLQPERGGAVAPVPPMTLGTLEQAAAAVPFTVLAADPPPPNGGLRVGWSAPAPDSSPR